MSEPAAPGKHRPVVNAFANWAGFAAQAVVAFFVAPILVRGLGDERYGIWALVESVLAYLMLFDLGVAASVVRYVACFEATRDQEGLNRVFSTSLCIFAAAGACALVVAVAVALAGTALLQVPPELLSEARWLLLLLGLNIAVGLPLSVFPSVLDGLGRYPIKTTIRTSALLVRAPLFLVVVSNGGGLLELAWVITGCNLLEHLAVAVTVWRCLPGLRFAPAFVDRTTFRAIRGYSLDAFVAMVAGRISFQTDGLVIAAFLAPQFITFFSIGNKLVETVKNSLRAATTVLTPAVSSLEARGDLEGIRRVLLTSTRYVLWLVLPLQVGLLTLGKPFLALWMSPRHAELCYPTLVILTVPLGLLLSQSVSGRILYGIGRLRWFSRLTVVEALANLVLSLALVVPLGVEGVALGTSIPNLVANVAVLVYICRTLGLSVTVYLRRSFLGPCLVVCPLAAAWLAVALLAPPTSWPAFLTVGALGTAGYALLAILVEAGPAAVLGRLRLPRVESSGRAATVTAVPPL
jgi:O-antigen/teichoic acid export membrane protein